MQSLKEILVDIAAAIVDHPDDVVVTEQEENNEVTLTLSVHADDMGMVIGKGGKIAIKLNENDVLVIEGIHGLNPELTASIPDEKKFEIVSVEKID